MFIGVIVYYVFFYGDLFYISRKPFITDTYNSVYLMKIKSGYSMLVWHPIADLEFMVEELT